MPSAGVVYHEESGHNVKLKLISRATLREKDPTIHYKFFRKVKYVHTSSKLYISSLTTGCAQSFVNQSYVSVENYASIFKVTETNDYHS